MTLPRLQVDQSSKVEQTNKPTVVAYSNGEQRALLVPARVKREVLAYLRAQGRESKIAVLLTFSALLALLLCDVASDAEEILLDDEYAGQRGVIKYQLIIYLERLGCRIDPDTIKFGFIGKKSPAHDLAIGVYRGERKPDRIVKAEDLLELMAKKRRRGPQSGKA